MKIIIFSNTSWSLYNFRLELIKKLLKNNEILLLSNSDKFTSELKQLNCKTKFIKINSHSKNIFTELLLLFRVSKIVKEYKPNLILSYTIKPNIYSLILNKFYSFHTIINITGLGNVFKKKNLTFFFISLSYKFLLKNSYYTFFQNKNDLEYFIKKKFISVNNENYQLIPGSGVDTNFFKRNKNKKYVNSNIRFLFSSRFIKEKGIINYLDAAKFIKKKYDKNVNFYLIGFNSSIKNKLINDLINKYSQKKYITNLGFKNSLDIKKILEQVDCFVLPSYYNEGVPRSLLEAVSMEVFIILGEKLENLKIVRDNKNGFICKSNDTKNLIYLMEKFIKLQKDNLSSELLKIRKEIIKNYDQKIVINAYEDQVNIIKNKYG